MRKIIERRLKQHFFRTTRVQTVALTCVPLAIRTDINLHCEIMVQI